jgi:hypothetical protein
MHQRRKESSVKTFASVHAIRVAIESAGAPATVACITVDTLAVVANTSIGSLVDPGLFTCLPRDSPFHHDRGP